MEMFLVYDSGKHVGLGLDLFSLVYMHIVDFRVLMLLFSMQNDLIHAWGLDVQLGYCAQVSFFF